MKNEAISTLVEFKTLQDMQETFQRMNITDITPATDNELLVQIFITTAQYQELAHLKCVKFIDTL